MSVDINLILSFKDKMFRLARRITGDYEDARDIVQESLIRLWEMADKIDAYANPEALAITITKNLSLDKMKSKHNRMKKIEIDEYEDLLVSEEISPERKAENNQLHELILELIEKLPQQQKIIFHLRDIEGYNNKEVADMLGLNENIVKINLSRARKKIRELLTKIYKYYEN